MKAIELWVKLASLDGFSFPDPTDAEHALRYDAAPIQVIVRCGHVSSAYSIFVFPVHENIAKDTTSASSTC